MRKVEDLFKVTKAASEKQGIWTQAVLSPETKLLTPILCSPNPLPQHATIGELIITEAVSCKVVSLIQAFQLWAVIYSSSYQNER